MVTIKFHVRVQTQGAAAVGANKGLTPLVQVPTIGPLRQELSLTALQRQRELNLVKTWIITISATLSLIFGGDSFAVRPAITVEGITPGSTPFISFVSFKVNDPANLSTVGFTVTPKPGSQTQSLPMPGISA
jgi:hypothetical protein